MPDLLKLQKPSPTLTKYASQIARLAPGPILDVPCGYGRNARLMDSFGCTVVCLDSNVMALQSIFDVSYRLWPFTNVKQGIESAGSFLPILANLGKDSWPFKPGTFGAIINVHFHMESLYEYFALSLRPGGFLYCETISGHGGNYLELPKAGELHHKLQRSFEFEVYKEKRTGPQSEDAVTVTLLGKKKTPAEIPRFLG